MLFRVDPGKDTPLADQIAACARRAIADGTVRGGDRLPAARELAKSLQVNMHTVLAGYQQLRDEGLIELRRGRGAVVSNQACAGRAQVTELIQQLVETARRIDMDNEELIGLIRSTSTATRQ